MANEEVKIRNVEHVLHVMTDLFLENGIDGTTKEMVSRESGLSRKSIDRYFYGKKACVLEAAEWLGQAVWNDFNDNYSERLFTDSKYTGAEILKMYLDDLKKIFISKPRVFVFYSEFKLYYARRDSDEYEKKHKHMLDTIGCCRIAEKIFAYGFNDGSLRQRMDAPLQAKYFCKSCFGFLSAMAIDYEYQPEETIFQIDQFIDGMIDLYCVREE
jgi:AcrR family transcriptional regulator